MNKIYARDFDIVSGVPNCADIIEKLFEKNNQDVEIYFDAGEYLVERYIDAANLNNVKIIGDKAVFSVKFNPCDPTSAQGAFRFYNCENVSVVGVAFTNDLNINSAGEVIDKDPIKLTYKVKLYDGFEMTGKEKMLAVDTLDDENTPDYVMVHYRGDTSYEYIGNNTLEVTLTEDHRQQIENLRIGHKIAIRHSLNVNPTIRLFGCKNFLLEDIRIYSSHSNILNIHPESENVTVRRMTVKAPDESKRLMTTNKDGIHVIGCRGTLILEDCEFYNMGDDSLNVHSKAATVSEVNNDIIKCVNIHYEDGVTFNEALSKSAPIEAWWAKIGDIIDVHDRKTFVKKASLKVKAHENGELVLEDSASIVPGDILCNSEYYCKTIVRGCRVYNTRARGFLFQTHDVLIENCSFYGIALSGILFAPDTVVWSEVGPSEDVVVRNNTFEKCCYDHGILSNGVIAFQESHDSYKRLGYKNVHKRIIIEGSKFKNSFNKAMYFSSAHDVVVRYNEITNCVDTKLADKVCIYAENSDELQVAINTITDGSGLLTKDVTGSCTYINANHLNRTRQMDIPQKEECQELVYKVTPQRDLALTVYQPLKMVYDKAPLLFMVPGGGWWTEKRSSMFEFIGQGVEFLRNQGFAVASIDYRVYSEPNVVMGDIVTDCFDALRYVAHYSDVLGIDKERISLISHSAGGHLSLMLAYADPKDFKSDYPLDCDFTIKSVAALSPLTNLKKSSNTFGFDCSKAFDGCDTDEVRLKHSPISYVSAKVPKTFLAAGTSDRIVYPNSSEQLYKKLLEHGVDCELMLSVCGGHVFEKMHDGIDPIPDKDYIIRKATEFILSNT